jgi:rfaE bifunctional protein kinase chain/domain
VNILVVGDIMLDKYTVGTVERISPEAPVPIVNVTDVYETLGGCGCVAVNARTLGANVWCMSSIGDDVYGNRIIDLLNDKGINSLVRKSSKLTTVKERVVAGARQIQMIRLDYEYKDLIYPEKIFPRLASDLKRQPYDYIIVSDYAKGVVTYALIDSLRTLNVPIVVDPKPANISKYSDVFMITPNKKEFEELNRSTDYAHYTLVTLGRDGMELYEYGLPHEDSKHIKSDPVDVYNVAGAGDVVSAVITVSMAMGFDPYNAAKIANACARDSVTHTGTCIVNKKVFDAEVIRTNI